MTAAHASPSTVMVERVADALLFEGYMLYPYRPTAVKNRQRFNFGVVYPPSPEIEVIEGADASRMRTECVVEGSVDTPLDVRVRFLQLVERVDARAPAPWQEAVEQSCAVPTVTIGALVREAHVAPIERAATVEEDGAVTRRRRSIDGTVTLSAVPLASDVFRVAAEIRNTSAVDTTRSHRRDDHLLQSLVSAHTILSVTNGRFVSLLDPPDVHRENVASCRGVRTWPVLVGDAGARDTMLSSPIIIYDYPLIAPESAGDLFDGTEIDEILSLRILTMTDAEQHEMRHADERARRLLERTLSLDAAQFMRMHGTLEGNAGPACGGCMNRIVTERAHGRAREPLNDSGWDILESEGRTIVGELLLGERRLQAGDRVRLNPHAGGDVFDLALKGQVATVQSIEQDFEGKFYVVVLLDADPGNSIGPRAPAHRFFFAPEEVEWLSVSDAGAADTRPLDILVAGIGNIFLGDDGFGVEVVQRLARRTLPAGVRVVDFGIRGYDLAYALVAGADRTILVDACPRGEIPGTVFVLQPELDSVDDAAQERAVLDAHDMNPMHVLRLARSLGATLHDVLVVGCEPATLGPDEGQMGLSEPVQAAVDIAVSRIESLVAELLSGIDPPHPAPISR